MRIFRWIPFCAVDAAACSLGEALIPVIMVDFSDKAFQPENDSAKVTRFFNEPGYADEKYCKGSVNDFFVAQSNGLFSPSFRVVAHVTLDNGYQYYGANGSDGELDPNLDVMVAEAIEKASATVDFAEYATNGAVPLVTVMFAGPGEQSSFEDGHDDYLWARYSTRPTRRRTSSSAARRTPRRTPGACCAATVRWSRPPRRRRTSAW